MENTGWLDVVMGATAIIILIAGLAMLFNGMSAFGDKKK